MWSFLLEARFIPLFLIVSCHCSWEQEKKLQGALGTLRRTTLASGDVVDGFVDCHWVPISAGTKSIVLSVNAEFTTYPVDVCVRFQFSQTSITQRQRRFGYNGISWCSSQDVAIAKEDADLIAVPQGAQKVQVSFRTKVPPQVRDVSIAECWFPHQQLALVCDMERHAAWGSHLDVKPLCQLTDGGDPSLYPEVVMDESSNYYGTPWPWICAPTCVTMVANYFTGGSFKIQGVAPSCYDPVSPISYGVWGINVAVLSSLIEASGWLAYVAKFSAWSQVEDCILNGEPVIASISWKPGELYGVLQEKSAGHMVVIVGFTKDGNVIVNDPLSSSPVIYDRQAFWHCWQRNGDGIVYIVQPI